MNEYTDDERERGVDLNTPMRFYPNDEQAICNLGVERAGKLVIGLFRWHRKGVLPQFDDEALQDTFDTLAIQHKREVEKHRENSERQSKRRKGKSRKNKTTDNHGSTTDNHGSTTDNHLIVSNLIVSNNNSKPNGGGRACACDAPELPDVPAAADFDLIERLIGRTAGALGDRSPNRKAWRDFIEKYGSAEFSRLAEEAKGKATKNAGALLSVMIRDYSPEAAREARLAAEREAQDREAERRARKAEEEARRLAAWQKAGKICEEECANYCDGRCRAGCLYPAAGNPEHPHPPRECPLFAALVKGGAA